VPPFRALEELAGDVEGYPAAASGPAVASPFAARAERALLEFVELIRDLRRAAKELEVERLLEYVVKRSGYADMIQDGTPEGEERWQNVKELSTVAAEWASLRPEAGLAHFLEQVALSSDVDDLNDEVDAVTLITLHAAKGLEFKVVFLVGMEEGVCPHSRSFDDPVRMEEERRLCYVGMTRAMERLYVVYAFRRTLFGSQTVNVPSRFVADIPQHLLAGEGATARAAAPSARERIARTELAEVSTRWPSRAGTSNVAQPRQPQFKPGDRVHHEKFGDGIVIRTELTRDDEEVSVAFARFGEKRISLSLATLQRV
jgi:DNA helicase-2/ATP-dependent DNA helicase PcrA